MNFKNVLNILGGLSSKGKIFSKILHLLNVNTVHVVLA
jgi:hypothetical protein